MGQVVSSQQIDRAFFVANRDQKFVLPTLHFRDEVAEKVNVRRMKKVYHESQSDISPIARAAPGLSESLQHNNDGLRVATVTLLVISSLVVDHFVDIQNGRPGPGAPLSEGQKPLKLRDAGEVGNVLVIDIH